MFKIIKKSMYKLISLLHALYILSCITIISNKIHIDAEKQFYRRSKNDKKINNIKNLKKSEIFQMYFTIKLFFTQLQNLLCVYMY